MAELAYVSLEEAAELEGIAYETIKKRAQRSPEKMGVKKEERDTGGKELTQPVEAGTEPVERTGETEGDDRYYSKTSSGRKEG